MWRPVRDPLTPQVDLEDKHNASAPYLPVGFGAVGRDYSLKRVSLSIDGTEWKLKRRYCHESFP